MQAYTNLCLVNKRIGIRLELAEIEMKLLVVKLKAGQQIVPFVFLGICFKCVACIALYVNAFFEV